MQWQLPRISALCCPFSLPHSPCFIGSPQRLPRFAEAKCSKAQRGVNCTSSVPQGTDWQSAEGVTAMGKRAFTETWIRSLKPHPVRRDFTEVGRRGFMLRLWPGGEKTFVLRYLKDGR